MPRSCACGGADAAAIKSVATILDRLGHDIELLGVALSGDADLVRRHSQVIQSVDHIAQQQRCLADILRSDAPAQTIDGAPLADLTHELRRALVDATSTAAT